MDPKVSNEPTERSLGESLRKLIAPLAISLSLTGEVQARETAAPPEPSRNLLENSNFPARSVVKSLQSDIKQNPAIKKELPPDAFENDPITALGKKDLQEKPQLELAADTGESVVVVNGEKRKYILEKSKHKKLLAPAFQNEVDIPGGKRDAFRGEINFGVHLDKAPTWAINPGVKQFIVFMDGLLSETTSGGRTKTAEQIKVDQQKFGDILNININDRDGLVYAREKYGLILAQFEKAAGLERESFSSLINKREIKKIEVQKYQALIPLTNNRTNVSREESTYIQNRRDQVSRREQKHLFEATRDLYNLEMRIKEMEQNHEMFVPNPLASSRQGVVFRRLSAYGESLNGTDDMRPMNIIDRNYYFTLFIGDPGALIERAVGATMFDHFHMPYELLQEKYSNQRNRSATEIASAREAEVRKNEEEFLNYARRLHASEDPSSRRKFQNLPEKVRMKIINEATVLP